ncbi:HPr family phosphocarrier protein [Thalassotalea ponticola]|uniref:HPr family phosphocarrier protein n=1 Tax=Thalassotalea ponticola TaxID=1523392 RepID=UPI0025B58763|nr:HPr family phosphocarrier protein [Thalassotalea ponticola]MDN3653509.1 HPr family phosphocarrier protein [Thalassotalea ponticola]
MAKTKSATSTHASRMVTIENKLGLHARAATKLAKLSQQFNSSIRIVLDGKTADAGSIMGLMLLTGSQGKTVAVECQGDDAEQALDAVCQLFGDKFDEAE